MNIRNALAIAMLALPAGAQAEVTGISPAGFSVRHSITTAARPEAAWDAIVDDIGNWWHPDHTWSGSAENLYIRGEAGGCFCERLPESGGSVEHMRIIYFAPRHEIRFDGTLGPLQQMAVQGRMIWTVAPAEAGSTITFRYLVHGDLEGGFAELAPGVDGVLGQQIQRLGQHLATL